MTMTRIRIALLAAALASRSGARRPLNRKRR